MSHRPIKSRRATILLLVVSILALLFVIVTGFLSLARTERAVTNDIAKSEITDAILDNTGEWAAKLIGDQLRDDNGGVASGGTNSSWEDIAGYRKSSFLAALEPVWDGGATNPMFPTPSQEVVHALKWPAVTSLDASVNSPKAFPVYQLMLETDQDDNAAFIWADVVRNARRPFMDADGDGVPDSHFLLSGPATEAANAMAGKSVQVPSFTGDNPAVDFVTYYIPADDNNPNEHRDQIWRRFDAARYEVAVRVVSNGGMIALQSPTLYEQDGTAWMPFNRDFTIGMFDAARDTRDRRMSLQYSDVINKQNPLFDALGEQTAQIETRLRRRFFLPAYGESRRRIVVRNSPPLLAELQGETRYGVGFANTLTATSFGSGLQSLNQSSIWQRINLGQDSGGGGGSYGNMGNAPDERMGWARSVALNPGDYNRNSGAGALQLRRQYDARHLTTAVSYSDELARKQVAGDPVPSTSNGGLDLTANRGSTYQGELKYYLGEVSKAFIEVDASGADSNGVHTGLYRYDRTRGNRIVEELTRYYFDMLGGHTDPTGTNDEWLSVYTTSGTGGKQAVNRRQQAFMLAVNTLAFAAPRNTDNTAAGTRGVVDVVRYTDTVGTTSLTYASYGPQLFFSEVIAYTQDDADPNDSDDVRSVDASLAIELYNPNDPYYDFGAGGPPYTDVYALPLDQYAITVNDEHPTGAADKVLLLGGTGATVAGRSFKTLAIDSNGDSNTHFKGLGFLELGSLNFVSDRGVGGGEFEDISENISLHLWRKRAAYPGAFTAIDPEWYQVDKLTNVIIPTIERQKRWRAKHRDTSPARYFGMVDTDNLNGVDVPGDDVSGDGFLADTYARWNIVTAIAKGDNKGSGAPITSTLDNHTWIKFTAAAPQGDKYDPDDLSGVVTPVPDPEVPFSPTTPLLTMNAVPVDTGVESRLYQMFNNLPMFGNTADLRPRSFPTVGFMHFIPRFSHIYNNVVAKKDAWKPVSVVLKEQWDRQSYPGKKPGEYPADFGHMPVFDNKQKVPAKSYFSNTDGVGEIPWGLLVYDYFTTLDRMRDANGDGETDIDPLRVPGRVNVNAAPWYVLSKLPMMGLDAAGTLPLLGGLAALPNITNGPVAPSPSFWSQRVGVLAGFANDVNNAGFITERLLANDPSYGSPGYEIPHPDLNTSQSNRGMYRLGPWLAQSAAAYRDGVQYLTHGDAFNTWYEPFISSHLRGGIGSKYTTGAGPVAIRPYRLELYGTSGGIRGVAEDKAITPTQFGFVTVGELLNVKGFDSSSPAARQLAHQRIGVNRQAGVLGKGYYYSGDFVKAVSIMALLDSQYLVTRSNTFTVYASVMDREDPKSSMRLQETVDRSDLLPRLTYVFEKRNPTTNLVVATYPVSGPNLNNPNVSYLPTVPALMDWSGPGGPTTPDGVPETPVRTIDQNAAVRTISTHRIGYFNARYDQ